MKTRKASWLALTASIPLLLAASVQADDFLIRETESLRDSLTSGDPSRLPLTLRLADLYMDSASSAAANKPRLQARALALYEEAARAKLAPAALLKVNFQRARLLSDLGRVDESVALWKTLAGQRDNPEISREAALRLAESGDVLNAERWYAQALELCSGGDLCSYIRFKRAWLFKQSATGGVADDRAIAEMELALFDSKGQPREESIRDLLVFLGERSGTDEARAREALGRVEALSQKLDRKSLIGELAEAYLAAGNRAAGAVVLAQAQRVEPKFSRLVRLAEEQYGARDWTAFAASLDEIASIRAASLMAASSDGERVEGEKILRRIVIQLDGERISQTSRKVDFQKATLAYLSLFPASPEKAKFQEGWLASEDDAQIKLDQLAEWLKTDGASIRLREFRASVAQKAGRQDVVASEMAALAAIPAASAKAREYRYLQARALYSKQDFAAALPIFESLAAVSEGAVPDAWAVQSQNLALDILAQQKNLDGVIARADSWVSSSFARSASLPAGLRKEISDMIQVRDQARFEKAVSLGDTPQALASFLEYCRTGVFADKSCENARILSVKLKDQASLITVLRLQGESRIVELAQELEASGEFAKAAEILEKQASKSTDVVQWLKIALLRELSGDGRAFSAVLKQMRQSSALVAKMDEKQESLWLSMAMDAARTDSTLLTAVTLKTLRSDASRTRLAEWLESAGTPTSETKKILLGASFQSGPAWGRLVLGEMTRMAESANAIGFHGKNSRANFEKRLKAVTALARRADEFFPKCEPATKSALAAILKESHERFAREIREAPIPEGVPAEAIAELKQGMEQMARPLDEKAAVYAQVILPVDASAAQDRIATTSAHPDRAAQGQWLAVLAGNPDSREALTALRDLNRSAGQGRLAAYFEGRLNPAGGAK